MLRRFASSVVRVGKVPSSGLAVSRRLPLLSTPSTGYYRSCFSTDAHSTANDLDKQLQMFPEYKTAASQEQAGQYKLVLPAYQRVYDSLASALGPKSPLTTHMMFKIASLYRQQGEYDKARSYLTASLHQNDLKSDSLTYVRINTHLALLSLLLNDRQNAVEYANEAVMLCESEHNHADSVNISLFSNSYSMLGLAHLATGNLSDAETFLQLAARWAQTPLEQLIALSNNGSLKWYQLAYENPGQSPFSIWESRLQQFQQNVKIAPTTTEEGKSVVGDAESENYRLLAEALQCWNETLADVNNTAPKNSSIAEAMCGPTGASAVQANVNMTGMAENEVKVLSSETKEDGKVDVMKGSVNAIESDSDYAIAYAHLLCNIAEAYEFTGRSVEGSDYLSSALKVLNPHTDMKAQVATARPLRMIATLNMKASQAVTAEGLFRSAIEKLQLPLAVHDPRCQYELALCKGYYGQLLCKWEKRELVGQGHKDEAKAVLVAQHAQGVPIDLRVQFPLL